MCKISNFGDFCVRMFKNIYKIIFDLICFGYFRGVYPPAEEYVKHAGKSHITLVDAFRNMQIEEGEELENGDSNHEVYTKRVKAVH